MTAPIWPACRSPFALKRRHAGSNAPHHVGRIVTRRRAMVVAARLFPNDIANGSDCRAEIGREGEPCRACNDRNRQWLRRIAATRIAMMESFE